MSYRKGKDIKVPFDCLWHYMTRKTDSIRVFAGTMEEKPEDFEIHEVQDLQ